MKVRDISFSSPAENILFDELLLILAEEGREGETLRFWESPTTFIVLGRTGKPEEELILEHVRRDNIPVLRRSSGGGTVVQGRGCLNFTLILFKERDSQLNDIRRSYQWILQRVLKVFAGLGVAAEFQPTSDLALSDGKKKFSGNAQRRGRRYILHHGTVLYDFPLDLISRYLALPKDQPPYRRGRTHLDFVTNLPMAPGRIKEMFAEIFEAGERAEKIPDEHTLLRSLLETKPPVIPIGE